MLNGMDVPTGGRGEPCPQYFQICKKVGQKVAMLQEKLATAFSVTFFLVKTVGQLVNPLPPTEGVSAHHCLMQDIDHFHVFLKT